MNDGVAQKMALIIDKNGKWEIQNNENQWGKLKKGSEKPNWICKDCYDGGIVAEK